LENEDPNRKYLLANRNDERTMMVYRYMGFVPEEYQPGGLRFKGGPTVKEGEELSYRGHVLMSISKEKWAEIQEVGYDGSSGWRMADEIEEKILDRHAGMDAIRGIGVRGQTGKPLLGVLNETEELERG
jgi:hypothetical protein